MMYLNVKVYEQPVKRRNVIIIDDIVFTSLDAAVNYLVADGMTGLQAMNYLRRMEVM